MVSKHEEMTDQVGCAESQKHDSPRLRYLESTKLIKFPAIGLSTQPLVLGMDVTQGGSVWIFINPVRN